MLSTFRAATRATLCLPPSGWRSRTVLAATVLVLGSVVRAEGDLVTGTAPAKREMRTDRPDDTESPFTVDRGHVQIESDFLAFTRNREDGVRSRTWSAAAFNIRYGTTTNTEVGIFVAPWNRIMVDGGGLPRSTTTGFGDITLRGKINFQGNDAGEWGTGLMADLTLPTAAKGFGDDVVSGAVALPIAKTLGEGWDLGAMTRVGFVPGRHGTRDRTLFENTVTVGHDFTSQVGMYVELASVAGDGSHVASFNLGFTLRPNSDLQFDAGTRIGISRAADDLSLFTGITRRF